MDMINAITDLPIIHIQKVLEVLKKELHQAQQMCKRVQSNNLAKPSHETLEMVLTAWEKTGNLESFVDYFRAIPTEYAKPPLIALTAWKASREMREPIFAMSHESLKEISAECDGENLLQHRKLIRQHIGVDSLPEVVKTLTGSVHMPDGKIFFMIAQIGTMPISPQIRKEISKATKLPLSRVKHMVLNDRDFDTVKQLGLAPGYVGPFSYRYMGLKYIFYIIAYPDDCSHPDLVALRFTPFDTLVFSRTVFESLLIAYAMWAKVNTIFL